MSPVQGDRVLESWEQGFAALAGVAGPPGERLHGRMDAVVRSILRWLEADDEEPDEALRSDFRRMAAAFRAEGVPTVRALETMSLLEDILLHTEVEGASRTPLRNARLTLCLRGLILDAVQMNMEMDARFFRERRDALAFFSEVLGHEIGNRLGAAQSAAEILRSPDIQVPEERREALLDLMIEGIGSALTSVDDVTALMSAHAGGGLDRASLQRVADGVVRTVGPIARKEGVRVSIVGELPDASVDTARMRLLLTNLTLNGVRYSDPGKAERFVEIDGSCQDGALEIRVSDNGIGVPEPEREVIFQYRERGAAGASHSTDGSGLGLAVVAEAVAQLGGEVGVASEVGEGSTFWLRIPSGGC